MAKPPTKPPYAQVPTAPKKKIADRNPIGAPAFGADVPPAVPPHAPSKVRSLGPAHARGYGHSPKHSIGHLRFSGHSGAHQVGKRK